ncbi:MAG: addiction module antidote protein [Rickettsiales bacterium]
MKPSKPFGETTAAALADDETALAYLEECLADANPELFTLALRQVADARLGGMTELSRAADLNREALYRSLSEDGNPRFYTLNKVLAAVGFRLSVAAIHSRA